MKFIPLGHRNVPAIGLGTYRLGKNETANIVRKALEVGYRLFDTAQLYENEEEIGNAILSSGVPREDIYLVVKVWPSNLHVHRFIPSIHESLNKLKTSYADLILVHWPHQSLRLENYIPILIEAKSAGLAKDIGVSNFNIEQLTSLRKISTEIVVNQVEYHPWINQQKLYDWMKEHHLPLMAYCPLAKAKMFQFKPLENLAAHYLKTPAQIILRWMMQKKDIIAIPRSSNLHRLEENINIFDFEIVEEDIAVIDAWRLENRRFVDAQGGAKWDR
jgi:2,5-diketo-D-gluconate reductase B